MPAHQCKLSGREFDDAGLLLLVGVGEPKTGRISWGSFGGLLYTVMLARSGSLLLARVNLLLGNGFH